MTFDLAPYRALYPFEPRTADIKGVKLSYLDEGPRDGEPLVMLHGNPTWSFYYRELVKEFRGTHRVIVPDHIGCGLSEKPSDDRYPYSLERRVDDVEALLGQLGITKDITLVLHDWGGMIGMAFATRHPERIRRIVLFNTGAFHLPASKPFPWALRICRDSSLGTLLVRGFNAFSAIASHVCAKQRPLPPAVRAAYRAPYDSWANRIATLRFVQDIPLSPGDRGYDIVTRVQENLHQFRKIPVLICWGEQDFVFDEPFLREWIRHLPEADVHRFPRAGHYVVEDALDQIVPLMREFLAAQPAAMEAAAR